MTHQNLMDHDLSIIDGLKFKVYVFCNDASHILLPFIWAMVPHLFVADLE